MSPHTAFPTIFFIHAAAITGTYGPTSTPAPTFSYVVHDLSALHAVGGNTPVGSTLSSASASGNFSASRGAPAVLARKRRSHNSDADYFDSYIPDGILRAGWAEKHIQRVPPLVILAFPFDPRQQGADWTASEAAIHGAYSDVRTLYAAERGAGVMIVLVNVQDLGGMAGNGANAPSSAGGLDGAGSPLSAPAISPDSFRLPAQAIEQNATERVAMLRRRAGLDGSSLVVLAGSDLAMGSPALVSLEALVRRRVGDYYQAATRRLKRAEARLAAVGAASQVPLRVRLLLKTGFFQEARLRHSKALKYFSAAYHLVAQIRPSSSSAPYATNGGLSPAQVAAASAAPGVPLPLVTGPGGVTLGEVKAVAELLNAKLMSLYASCGAAIVTTPAGITGLSGAQAAVMQLQAHLRTWEGAVGDPSAAHAHWGWVSRQYALAGDLLQLYLPRPGPDTRAQHVASHYFAAAAAAAVKRREAAAAAGLVSPLGGPVPPAGQAAVAEASRSQLVPSPYHGGRPRAAPLPALADGPAGPMTSADESAAWTAHARAAEASHRHSDDVLSLLDKAQTTSPIDGGAGSHAASRSGPPLPSLSGFALALSSDCSLHRLVRTVAVAEELAYWQGGKAGAAPASRLLAPVARLLHWWETHRGGLSAPSDRSSSSGISAVIPAGSALALSVGSAAGVIGGWRSLRHRVAACLYVCAITLADAPLLATACIELLAATSGVSQADACIAPTGPAVPSAALRTLTRAAVMRTLSGLVRPAPSQPLALPGPMALTLPPFLWRQFIAVSVSFDRHVSVAGTSGSGSVGVTLTLSSTLPTTVVLDSVRLRFGAAPGDVSSGANAAAAAVWPVASGATAVSPFDLLLTHQAGDGSPSSAAPGPARLALSGQAPGGSLLATASLALPARGLLSFAYCVALQPSRAWAPGSLVTAVTAALQQDAASPATSSGSGARSSDWTCTDSLTMASVLPAAAPGSTPGTRAGVVDGQEVTLVTSNSSGGGNPSATGQQLPAGAGAVPAATATESALSSVAIQPDSTGADAAAAFVAGSFSHWPLCATLTWTGGAGDAAAGTPPPPTARPVEFVYPLTPALSSASLSGGYAPHMLPSGTLGSPVPVFTSTPLEGPSGSGSLGTTLPMAPPAQLLAQHASAHPSDGTAPFAGQAHLHAPSAVAALTSMTGTVRAKTQTRGYTAVYDDGTDACTGFEPAGEDKGKKEVAAEAAAAEEAAAASASATSAYVAELQAGGFVRESSATAMTSAVVKVRPARVTYTAGEGSYVHAPGPTPLAAACSASQLLLVVPPTPRLRVAVEPLTGAAAAALSAVHGALTPVRIVVDNSVPDSEWSDEGWTQEVAPGGALSLSASGKGGVRVLVPQGTPVVGRDGKAAPAAGGSATAAGPLVELGSAASDAPLALALPRVPVGAVFSTIVFVAPATSGDAPATAATLVARAHYCTAPLGDSVPMLSASGLAPLTLRPSFACEPEVEATPDPATCPLPLTTDLSGLPQPFAALPPTALLAPAPTTVGSAPPPPPVSASLTAGCRGSVVIHLACNVPLPVAVAAVRLRPAAGSGVAVSTTDPELAAALGLAGAGARPLVLPPGARVALPLTVLVGPSAGTFPLGAVELVYAVAAGAKGAIGPQASSATPLTAVVPLPAVTVAPQPPIRVTIASPLGTSAALPKDPTAPIPIAVTLTNTTAHVHVVEVSIGGVDGVPAPGGSGGPGGVSAGLAALRASYASIVAAGSGAAHQGLPQGLPVHLPPSAVAALMAAVGPTTASSAGEAKAGGAPQPAPAPPHQFHLPAGQPPSVTVDLLPGGSRTVSWSVHPPPADSPQSSAGGAKSVAAAAVVVALPTISVRVTADTPSTHAPPAVALAAASLAPLPGALRYLLPAPSTGGETQLAAALAAQPVQLPEATPQAAPAAGVPAVTVATWGVPQRSQPDSKGQGALAGPRLAVRISA